MYFLGTQFESSPISVITVNVVVVGSASYLFCISLSKYEECIKHTHCLIAGTFESLNNMGLFVSLLVVGLRDVPVVSHVVMETRNVIIKSFGSHVKFQECLLLILQQYRMLSAIRHNLHLVLHRRRMFIEGICICLSSSLSGASQVKVGCGRLQCVLCIIKQGSDVERDQKSGWNINKNQKWRLRRICLMNFLIGLRLWKCLTNCGQ